LAESGRTSRPFSPDSFSMAHRVSRRWLLGRCPSTSPVKMKSAPSRSMTSLAFFIMKMRQSTQGLALAPYPYLGLRIMSRYCWPEMSMYSISISRSAAARSASFCGMLPSWRPPLRRCVSVMQKPV
jgi:hypothetical protein